ncbi:hypothetical protein LTR62_003004 [Meristemomyces frigidus]|uniref:Sphingoid long-chain base transporter RSB1 n=1 Tax=Meristemomyces frigidus TaxID=1508187 RepID=A0AAN7YJW8_9PEZI|nr:hypothetical protein LTR62_003004 [Meristemomyces frigidus]
MDSLLTTRANENGICTKDTCPVIYSIYGYRPNLGSVIFFLLLFSLSGLLYVYQGVRTRTKFFTSAMVLGSAAEVIGYVAKILLYQDPFSDTGFKMSLVMLTMAPAFYAAGLYYTLKHICLTFGANHSRLRPALYTYIFVGCDVFSIVLQSVGGALASVSENKALLDAGTDVMITGLATQVVTMATFGILAADYGLTVYRHRHHLNPATASFRHTRKFKFFLVALWVAYLGILIRCCYRVAELAGGWSHNPILRNQYLFIGLDGTAVGLAAIALNICHPGWCLPKAEAAAVTETIEYSTAKA